MASRIAPVVVLAALLVSPHAGAQTTGVSGDVHLVGQPLWHARGDRLSLSIGVTNTSDTTLDGFRLLLALYDRAFTRSELHGSFDGVAAIAPNVVPRDFSDRLAPGATTTVRIDDPIETFDLLATGSEGIYPLTVSLLDADGQPLDDLTTQLVYHPTPPPTPLNAVVVVPVAEIPARGPSGVFGDSGMTPRLEDAIEPGGTLDGLLDALERHAGTQLPIALVPSARTVEELADMTDGYQRAVPGDLGLGDVAPAAPEATAAASVLQRLRTLARTPDVEVMLAPYALPDLPTLHASLPADRRVEDLIAHLGEAETVLSEELGVGDYLGRWFFAPGARLDRDSLDALRQLGAASHTLFSESSLVPSPDPATAGCPQPFSSFTCAVEVATLHGDARGFVADTALQALLVELARDGDPLALQRVFAETAMIHAELPGTARRVVPIVLPPLWHADPVLSARFVAGLARVPWLRPLTPTRALDVAGAPVARETTSDIVRIRDDPGIGYYAAVAAARAAVDVFAEIRPPTALMERLKRNLLVAQSRLWWSEENRSDVGVAYATASRDRVATELGKIRIGGADQITLTSRRGSVQLLLFNDTGYPVTLQVELFSPKLTFERLSPREFEPEQTPLTVDVTARSSGIFPITVTLSTPEGTPIDSPGWARQISVRSTELNQIALLLTLGALGFLVFFYVWRGVRTRRPPPGEESAGAHAA